MGKKGVLLINLGTPDSTKVSDVRRYLREFLMDKYVIDVPAFPRWMLVNLIIAPFRGPKSAEEYRKLWTDRGSPLLYHGLDLKEALQKNLGDDFHVAFGMRYQNPGIKGALEELKTEGVSEITAIPLYPQFAEATTRSSIEKVEAEAKKIGGLPEIKFIDKYPDNDLMIEAFVANAKTWTDKNNYDHFVFSYHGLPERQIMKGPGGDQCELGKCCDTYTEKNSHCYRAQCFHTSRKLAEKLGLSTDQYTTCFQSRLGKAEWIKPYTEEKVRELAAGKKRNVLVFCPAFTADCLETTIEVGEAYQEEFLKSGGERWDLVESLNSREKWVDSLSEMINS